MRKKRKAAGHAVGICLMLMTMAAAPLPAKVNPHENIIANGRFDCDQMKVPPCWILKENSDKCECNSSGGPGGIPCVTFSNATGAPKRRFCLRQYGLTLVPGAKYRLSAKVRTKGFSSGNFGVSIANHDWTKEIRAGKIKSDQEWTDYSSVVEMVPSNAKDSYFAVFYAVDYKGEISAADVRLEAVDEHALAGSVKPSVGGDPRRPRLVPIRPLLAQIPKTRREVVFRFYGTLPEGSKRSDFEVALSTSDSSATLRTPLQPVETIAALPEKARDGRMTVRLLRRTDGSELLSDTYRFTVIDPPGVAADSGRRLNTLVRELLNEVVASDDADYSFSLAKESWVFLSMPKAGATVVLDGRIVIDDVALNGETFRRTAVGRHVVKVRGGRGARLIARKVPELFADMARQNSFVKENGAYDWTFCEKHVFPAMPGQTRGSIPKDKIPLFKRRGGEWLEAPSITGFKTSDEFLKCLRAAPGMTRPDFAGIECDEVFFTKPAQFSEYSQALKAFCLDDPGERIVFTCAVGRPCTPGVDQEFVSACANASCGRGRVIYEIYCRTKQTEAEARAYLDDYLKGSVKAYADLYPGAFDSLGVFLANFNQIPLISVHHHPEVDVKYFLDMQLNLIANDPLFEGLGSISYWSCYYADREFYRWSMALARHYCVEGRTDMLSAKYGYRYLPGHLANCDFREGLSGWEVEASVSSDKIKGLGENLERRWYSGGIGDDFALFTKRPGETARLTQKATGLVPGRLYCLQGCVFDAKAAREGRNAGHAALDLAIEGVDIDAKQSWRHIDKRVTANKPVTVVNLIHTVFRATGTEATVTLSNAAAPDGSELGANFISLLPFYPETGDDGES